MKKIINLFRGKVDYKEAFEKIAKRLEVVAEERDTLKRENDQLKYALLELETDLTKYKDKYKVKRIANKEMLEELNTKDRELFKAKKIIEELNKELSEEKKKPKKSVKNYYTKTEKELF